jgi:hypothetical protein
MTEDQIKALFEVNIIDTFEKVHIYEPQDDMTGKEAALIAQALLTASMMRLHNMGIPLWPYIVEHKLERHFPLKVEIALA